QFQVRYSLFYYKDYKRLIHFLVGSPLYWEDFGARLLTRPQPCRCLHRPKVHDRAIGAHDALLPYLGAPVAPPLPIGSAGCNSALMALHGSVRCPIASLYAFSWWE